MSVVCRNKNKICIIYQTPVSWYKVKAAWLAIVHMAGLGGKLWIGLLSQEIQGDAPNPLCEETRILDLAVKCQVRGHYDWLFSMGSMCLKACEQWRVCGYFDLIHRRAEVFYYDNFIICIGLCVIRLKGPIR